MLFVANSSSGTQKLEAFWQLYKLNYLQYPDVAKSYLYNIKQLAESQDNDYWLAKVYLGESVLLMEKKQYGDAISLSFQSASMFKKLKKNMETADNLYNIGHMYSAGHEWDNSLFYYKEALKLYEKEENATYLPYTQIGIGRCYAKKAEYDTAEMYYQSALKLLIDRGNYFMLSWCYNSLGALCFEKGEYERARSYYKKSISIEGFQSDDRQISIAYNNIGEAYLEEGQWDAAELWLLEAFELKEKIGDPEFKLSTGVLLAKLKKAKGQYKEALSSLQSDLRGVPTQVYNEVLVTALNLINDIYKLTDIEHRKNNVDYLIEVSELKSGQIAILVALKQKLEDLNNKYVIELSVEQYNARVELDKAMGKVSMAWLNFAIAVVVLGIIALILTMKYRRALAAYLVKAKALDEKDCILNEKDRMLDEKTRMLNNLEHILKEGKRYIESRKDRY
ncbi:hypothetical protein GCM10009122_14130 [Fulvivirga kasyanovii]